MTCQSTKLDLANTQCSLPHGVDNSLGVSLRLNVAVMRAYSTIKKDQNHGKEISSP